MVKLSDETRGMDLRYHRAGDFGGESLHCRPVDVVIGVHLLHVLGVSSVGVGECGVS